MRIVFLVTFCHILAFAFFFNGKAPSIKKTKNAPISVITMTMKEKNSSHSPAPPATSIPPLMQAPSAPPPPPPPVVEKAKAAPKMVTTTPAKKKAAPAVQKKVEAKNNAPVVKKQDHQKEVLGLLQKSLSKVESKGEAKTSGNAKLTLQSEGFAHKSSFEEELVLYLQSQLKVSKSGSVTLQLTLTDKGEVKEVQIKKCPLAENRSYLEAILPKLAYPSFSKDFPKEKSKVFALTFYID